MVSEEIDATAYTVSIGYKKMHEIVCLNREKNRERKTFPETNEQIILTLSRVCGPPFDDPKGRW